MKNLLAAIITTLVLCSACTQYRVVTEDMRQEYGWTKSDLQKMQFYLSDDVVLRQVKSGGKTEIEEGKVKVIDGKKVNEIVIEEGTPGVLLFMPKENRMAVSFEGNGDEKFLMFGPNPNYDNRYMLLAAEWKEHAGIVTYNGNRYATDISSSLASLMIDMRDINMVKKKTHRADGRTVN